MQARQLLDEHAAILEMFSQLETALAADRPQDVVALRWKMNRVLNAHLALEDQLVYPVLAACPNGETAALAKRMMSEIGDLAAKWRDYITLWTTGDIRARPDDFRAHTAAVRAALHERIEREERDLFPRLTSASCMARGSVSCPSAAGCARA
jgi:hemerythrin-like domain-containing protein